MADQATETSAAQRRHRPMLQSQLLIILTLLFLLTAGVAPALAIVSIPLPGGRLLGTLGSGGTLSTLVEVDPTSGAITVIGPVGYTVNGMVYDPTTNKLYGGARWGAYNGLIEIDPGTGAGTPVGVNGWGLGGAAITNIKVNAAGEMYGWWDPGQDDLVRVDKTTGIATRVGESGVGTAQNGLAFDNTDTLFMVNAGGQYYTVNTTTGAATSAGNLGITAHHGDIDKASNLYYGISSPWGDRSLVIANLATGSVLATYPTNPELHTLAFVGESVVTVGAASGPEDTDLPLNIQPVPGLDVEILSITISGLPAGTSLSAGTNLGGGTWELTVAQLAGLTLLNPPANSNVDFSLTVTVDYHDNEDNQDKVENHSLLVDLIGVADDPTLGASLVPPYGWQQTVPVHIQVDLADTDGSEDFQVIISNLPADAFFNHGFRAKNGDWILESWELDGLLLAVPFRLNYYLALTLGFEVLVFENDGDSTVVQESSTVISLKELLGTDNAGENDPPSNVVMTSGGCALGAGRDGFDPLLPLLTLGAAFCLLRRRRV